MLRVFAQAFQGCYKVGTKVLPRMLQGCYKGVTIVLLVYFYKGVVMVFHWCFNEVIRVLQECCLKGIMVFLRCHKAVVQLFHWGAI